MSVGPMKRTGFQTSVHQVTTDMREMVGRLRILDDGRKFRYARAGAAALGAGKMGVAADIAADVLDKAMPTTAIGAKSLVFTCGSATYVQDYFKGGFLQINDAAGEGYQYAIESSSAILSNVSLYPSMLIFFTF